MAAVTNTTDDVEIGSTIFKNANVPVTLKFEDVVCKIKKSVKSDAKTILNGVSGVVFPGEMLAMLGPSGSGKTTLLTALGGRLATGSISGAVTYNGKPFSNGMKRNTGFVTQDDVLYPHLTVTETLVYTALLRLPSTLSTSEKTQQAETVISQLGLSRCRNSIIGSHFLRGVSGGERKRVSIGQEMLINPSLLFLDEPTSGLDSTTAQRIVSTLKELADGGRTILMTVHQPSSRLFYMFHKVLLLCEGNPLYFGNGSASLDYFSSIGFSLTVAMNPADFLLDLANGSYTGDSLEDQALVKQTLISAYRQNLSDSIRGELAVDNQLDYPANNKQFTRWSNSWWQQFSILFRRGLKERKHESFAGLKVFQVLSVAILSGLLWFQSHSIQDKVGLLFFTSGFWSFYPLFQAIFTFPKERMMLEKERSSGMYRLSSYFAALTLGDLPMELILPTAFFTIVYWMAGLKPNPVAFMSGLFALLYSILVSQGLGLAIGAVIMDEKSATILGSVIVLTFLLASGYYVQHVPGFIAWVKYISLTQYTFKVLLLSQYTHDETYLCGGEGGGVFRVGDLAVVKAVGLNGFVVSIVALAVMLVGYRLVAYLALMRLGVTRKY